MAVKTKLQKKRILIAEDERPMAEALAAKLSHADFETVIAPDGEQALEMLHSSNCDLLILDIVMPRMNGFKLLEILKNENNKIPVIVLSNLSQEEDIARAKSLGALDYYIKTDTPLSLITRRVQSILNSDSNPK